MLQDPLYEPARTDVLTAADRYAGLAFATAAAAAIRELHFQCQRIDAKANKVGPQFDGPISRPIRHMEVIRKRSIEVLFDQTRVARSSSSIKWRVATREYHVRASMSIVRHRLKIDNSHRERPSAPPA